MHEQMDDARLVSFNCRKIAFKLMVKYKVELFISKLKGEVVLDGNRWLQIMCFICKN